MVAKKKAVKKKPAKKPRTARESATALATAALKRAQTRSVMEDVKSRYAARYGRAPTEAMARSIMAAIAAGIPIDATFRDPDPLVVAPPTQTQVPLVAMNSGPQGQAGRPRVVPAALVPQVGPAQGQAPNAVDMMLRQRAANRRIAAIQNQFLAANEPNLQAANRRVAAIQNQFLAPGALVQGQDAPMQQLAQEPPFDRAAAANRRLAALQRQLNPPAPARAPMTAERAEAANRRVAAIQNQFLAPGALASELSGPQGVPARETIDPAALARAREIARLQNNTYLRVPALAEEVQDAPMRQGPTSRQRAEAAFNTLLSRRTGLQQVQDDPVRKLTRVPDALEEVRSGPQTRQPAALEGDQSGPLGRPTIRPPVLVQDPVSANTGESTARLQQRDQELTVLRESRDAAVRAMQEQAAEQAAEPYAVRPPEDKRKKKRNDEFDLVQALQNMNVVPTAVNDFDPDYGLRQLQGFEAWRAGPLGENPVIPEAPPGMQVRMRLDTKTGRMRPLIRNGQVQFEPAAILLPNAPIPDAPPMPAAPRTQAERNAAVRASIQAAQAARARAAAPVDEAAAFRARAAAHAAGLQEARERQTAQAAASYQQQMAARNAPPQEVGDVSMNFADEPPREPVLPAEGEVGTFDDLGEGSKVQSVAFPIDQWSSASALRWLRSHGFVPQKKGESKANFLRYRIRAPRFSRYITRAVHSKGRTIHLIIGA